MIFMGELAWFHGFPQYWPDFTGLTVGLTPVSSFDPGGPRTVGSFFCALECAGVGC